MPTDAFRANLAQMPQLAEACAQKVEADTGRALRFERDDLALVDQILESMGAAAPEVQRSALVKLFGAYVGETVRRQLGGEWQYDPEVRDYCVAKVRDEGTRAYPFARVAKCLANGREDSVLFWYDVIAASAGTSEA